MTQRKAATTYKPSPKPKLHVIDWEGRWGEVVDENIRLTKIVDKLKKTKEHNESVYERVIKAEVGKLTIPLVPAPAKSATVSDREEVALAMVSDIQLAKVTKTPDGKESYNSKIAERRMEEYAQKIIKITQMQRHVRPVTKCVVEVLGDIIEGENIFSGQSYLIDGGLYRQITVDGPRIIVNFLRTLLTAFDTVEVVWVIGNHGRLSKDFYDPESNGDRMLGRIVQQLLANEPRLSWTLPDGRGDKHWYAISKIGKYSALCMHGDQVRGANMGMAMLHKKVNGWASGALGNDSNFKDVHYGHHHQLAMYPVNKRNAYCNGTTESYNTWAIEELGSMGDPSQWLLFVDPKVGIVTSQYAVKLT